MARHYKSIKNMVKNKELDLLLVIELEKERLFPDRTADCLFGQFVILYDLIPNLELPFTNMIIKRTDIKTYFEKYLIQEKKINIFPKDLLKQARNFLTSYRMQDDTYYIVNSKHLLKELT